MAVPRNPQPPVTRTRIRSIVCKIWDELRMGRGRVQQGLLSPRILVRVFRQSFRSNLQSLWVMDPSRESLDAKSSAQNVM
jgi:hypothetical protein